VVATEIHPGESKHSLMSAEQNETIARRFLEGSSAMGILKWWMSCEHEREKGAEPQAAGKS
jgi:hypothetical protein